MFSQVGVVKQTETSAIKSSGVNKNALFDRRLSGLYTRSTLVGEGILMFVCMCVLCVLSVFVSVMNDSVTD